MVTEKRTLKSLRKEIGLSQRQLANIAGIHYNSLSSYENGKPVLKVIARVLLGSINDQRRNLDLPELKAEDVDWNLR